MRAVRSAVVLAGGAGVRFWPYSVIRQKAAFPIAGKAMVRRLVEELASLGIEQIVVVTGAGEGSVRAALHDCAARVKFVAQGTTAGSAIATLAGLAACELPALVVHGDCVTDRANLAALAAAWRVRDEPALALVQPLGREAPQDWLVAHVVGEQVTGFEGHPRQGSHRYAGAVVLDESALPALRDNPGVMTRVPVGGMPPPEAELVQSLQMLIDSGRPVGAVQTVGYHVDVDKPWQVLEANEAVIRAMVEQVEGDVIPAGSRIHDGAEVGGRLVLGKGCTVGNRVVLRGDVWLGDGATIDNGAILEGPAVVGAGAVVRDYALIGAASSLGPRGIYGHGAEFSGVALEKVHCYHYCEIWGVVGHAVDFGAATVCGNLRFDDGPTTWRINGRPEIPTIGANAAYFGDFCRTGVNAIIMPGRRIGTYAVVGAGVVLYDDLPDRQMVLLKQDLVTRPWGPERYGW